jgi:hypothetical protein
VPESTTKHCSSYEFPKVLKVLKVLVKLVNICAIGTLFFTQLKFKGLLLIGDLSLLFLLKDSHLDFPPPFFGLFLITVLNPLPVLKEFLLFLVLNLHSEV